MIISEIEGSSDRKGPMCPFLGLKDDSTTALSFPSSGNHCFHAKPVLPVKLEFQGTHCLSSNHTNCEEFIRRPDTPLLPNLRYERSSSFRRRTAKAYRWFFLLVIPVAALIVWLVLSRGQMGPGGSKPVPGGKNPATSTSVELSSEPILPTQAQDTPTPTIAVTATATIPSKLNSPTPTNPPSHALETPIALDALGINLIIHRVVEGESLPAIASYYWTTPEAIQAINYHLQLPITIDWYVVIPVNQTDVHTLPLFEPYSVQADIVTETFAQQLSIDPSVLKLYNGLKDGEVIKKGEWLLIPHVPVATPIASPVATQ
jgi:LysM repeat protein